MSACRLLSRKSNGWSSSLEAFDEVCGRPQPVVAPRPSKRPVVLGPVRETRAPACARLKRPPGSRVVAPAVTVLLRTPGQHSPPRRRTNRCTAKRRATTPGDISHLRCRCILHPLRSHRLDQCSHFTSAGAIGSSPVLVMTGAAAGDDRYLTSARAASGSFEPTAMPAEKIVTCWTSGGSGPT